MSNLVVRLFGKLSVERDGAAVPGLEARKVQELLGYLLLHRTRPQPRETLAGLLWPDYATAPAKSYLRKALWQLQAALDEPAGQTPVLLVDAEWIRLNPAADLWLDVAVLEDALGQVRGAAGAALLPTAVERLQEAAACYTGDLLEGWYLDWCLYERERLQLLALTLLDKLMDFCEAHQRYDAGIGYGAHILRVDPASERTHRRLMRLYYLAGDRTAALRQFERCAAILARELDTEPDQTTRALYQDIRSNHGLRTAATNASAPEGGVSLLDILGRLKQFHTLLSETQRQVLQDIQAVEQMISRWR